MFCGKCGSKLDETTGRCPLCDGPAVQTPLQQQAEQQPVQQALQEPMKAQKKSHTALWMTLIISFLVIGFAVAGYFVWKHFTDGDNSNDKINQTVGTLYTDTIHSKLVNDVGFLSDHYKKRGAEGLISAKELDFDGDGKNEYVSVYAKNKGSRSAYYVSGYSYDAEKLKAYTGNGGNRSSANNSDSGSSGNSDNDSDIGGTSAENTSPIEETELIAFEEETDAHTFYDMAAYELSYKGKNYVFVERVDYFQGYSYMCRVYTMENGKLKEVANVMEPNISSTGKCIVCTSAPWAGKSIDNADLDSKVAEDWEAEKEHYVDKDSVVLFYDAGAGEDTPYRYTSYYDSKEEAVLDLFKSFGIKKDEYVLTDSEKSGRLTLNIDEDTALLYRYSYYKDKDESGEETDQFDFKDYTDIVAVIGTSTEKDAPQEIDIKKQITDAVSFENEFFKAEHWDKDDTIEGENGFVLTLFKYGDIKTWDQLKASYEQYYTSEAFDKSFAMYKHKETEKGLYINVPGFDGTDANTVLEYTKVSDTEYSFTGYNYRPLVISDGLEKYETQFRMLYQDGKWVFDSMLPFDLVDFALIEKGNEKDAARLEQFEAYCKKIAEESKINGEKENYGEYLYYDIDNDGVGELITVTGTYEQDKTIRYYGFENHDAYLIATKSGYHGSFYISKSGALAICTYGHGGFLLNEVVLKDKNIEEEEKMSETYDESTFDALMDRVKENYDEAQMTKLDNDYVLFCAVFGIEGEREYSID